MISTARINPSVSKAIADIKRSTERLWQSLGRDLAMENLPEVLSSLQKHHRQVHEWVFQLAIEQTGDTSLLTDVQFALLLLGSGARGEQLLATDQDHAFIYQLPVAHSDRSGEWDGRLELLGSTFAALLHEVGYPLCTGNVMMSNKRWRGSLQDWQERIKHYADFPDWENIRFLLIAADTGLVTGKWELAQEVRRLVANNVARSPFICWKIADQGLTQRVPTSVVSGWRERFGDSIFKVKDKFYTPLVNTIRLWALSVGIDEVGTRARIEQLQAQKVWAGELAIEIQSAFDLALWLRLKNQMTLALAGRNIIDDMDVALLSDQEKEALKRSLRSVKELQQLSARHFPRPR